MKLADLDEMAAEESEAYMSVQSRADVGDITKAVNEVVHKKIQQLIADTPAIDAVPVVRCVNCRHLMISGCYGECGRGYMGIVNPWDYCSYGEREDKEE